MLSMRVLMGFHAYETVTDEFHSHASNLFSLMLITFLCQLFFINVTSYLILRKV
jgi:hypothetical protein